LFEAVFLSLIGGAVGIFLVWMMSYINFGSLKLVLTFGNVMFGLLTATFIGVLSGIVPAWVAARLDPVTAIRSK